MVLASAARYPRAPWWNPSSEASVLPTGGIAGLLHAHGVEHRWLEPATEFCWRTLDAIPERIQAGDFLVQIAYDVRSALLFIDHAPERSRAEAVCADLGRRLIDAGVVALDPGATGEVAMPLDLAPRPKSLARRWFDDATIETHLDALVGAQLEDGGWPINWQVWTPVTGPEWRGWQTVERTKILAAYGRFGTAQGPK